MFERKYYIFSLSFLQHLHDIINKGTRFAASVRTLSRILLVVLQAEFQEALAFLRLKLDKFVRDFLQPSVNIVEILQAREIFPQIFRWMLYEQLLHFNQDIKSTDKIRVLRVEGLSYAGSASHYYA